MILNTRVNFQRFEEKFQVVDAHTVGEFCRVVTGGFPEPEGISMMDRKRWMETHYDHVRTALMHEPRGHHDMFGAFLCEPVHEEADFGIIFMDTEGYLNMCGHCTIGSVTVILETGLKPSVDGANEVILETPSGLIHAEAMVKGGKVGSVTLTNIPSFVYKDNLTVNIDGKNIPFSISFGGSFFALVNIEDTDINEITPVTVPEITTLGMKLLGKINETVKVSHPFLDITTVDLVDFYGTAPDRNKADMRSVVIFGDSMADRSPGGTALSAMLARLYKEKKISIGQEFISESFIGSTFKGVITGTQKVGNYNAIVPEITGSSYLTGISTYLIDPSDPLKYGFQATSREDF